MGGDSWRQGHGPGPVPAATTNSDAAGTSEERLQEIFRSLDRNDDGRLDGAELDVSALDCVLFFCAGRHDSGREAATAGEGPWAPADLPKNAPHLPG